MADFGIALVLLDRSDVESRPAFALSGQCCVDRIDLALAPRRRGNCGVESRAVALRDDAADRVTLRRRPLALQHILEQIDKQTVAAGDTAVAVDRCDRHRGIVEEAHETHFRRPQRVDAVAARAVEDEGARRSGGGVGRKCHLVIEPHRQGAAVAAPQIEVEDIGLHLAGLSRQGGEKCSAAAGQDVAEPQAAGADLGEIVIEPAGQRRVDVADVAIGIDREETGRRVVEIVDGVLQLLKHVFLAFTVAGHIGDGPH